MSTSSILVYNTCAQNLNLNRVTDAEDISDNTTINDNTANMSASRADTPNSSAGNNVLTMKTAAHLLSRRRNV
jgi:hypothetical protein